MPYVVDVRLGASAYLARTQVSTKIMKRDWFAILVIVIETAIILTAGALAYTMLGSN
jgi:hypothetical protein